MNRSSLFLSLPSRAAVFSRDTQAVGIARLGQADQVIAVASLAQLAVADLGAPLHSLVIPGATHFLEDDMLKFYREQWAASPEAIASAPAAAGGAAAAAATAAAPAAAQ